MDVQNWIVLVTNLGTSTAYALILLYFVLNKISKALDSISEKLSEVHDRMEEKLDDIEKKIEKMR